MMWEYLVVDVEGGMVDLKQVMGHEHRQSLLGALAYLGAQRWELVTTLTKSTLGTTTAHSLIFKRPQG